MESVRISWARKCWTSASNSAQIELEVKLMVTKIFTHRITEANSSSFDKHTRIACVYWVVASCKKNVPIIIKNDESMYDGCSYRQYIHLYCVLYIPWISKYSHNFCFVSVFCPNDAECLWLCLLGFCQFGCVMCGSPFTNGDTWSDKFVHIVILKSPMWFNVTPYQRKLKREPKSKGNDCNGQNEPYIFHASLTAHCTISLKLWCTKYPFYLMLMQSIQLAADSCEAQNLYATIKHINDTRLPGVILLLHSYNGMVWSKWANSFWFVFERRNQPTLAHSHMQIQMKKEEKWKNTPFNWNIFTFFVYK